ncbi:RNA-binding protein [Brachybacterium endophyticum]|uniref:RNA-binding protein n=1 Tax=Brachybacterium endophyticum TaxID=2182385 RepID=A0A2U2RJA9_9MICO|nr:R3H domain-containing nucleic acid-binding protein [Brachybacterium endophyticum]PWH05957.1 RNA-binding protein [Brachybacterium endophyticum]
MTQSHSSSESAVEAADAPHEDPAAPEETVVADTAESVQDAEVTDAEVGDAEADQIVAGESESDGSEEADGSSEEAGSGSQEHVKGLEEEGDIAADYLEELLDIADLDGDIDIDVDGDRASVEIRGADRLARLNRPKGELLDALQELARLAVQTRTGNRSRLMLDIGGFRAERKEDLEGLAEDAVAKAGETGQPVPLRPMNPFERKVVHDVAKEAGLRSESDGDGKDRHVVIYPAS